MKVGINSRMVREFSSFGKISAKFVDVVEISLAELDFPIFKESIIENAVNLRELYGIDFTIHAPYQDSPIDYLRVDLCRNRQENLKILKKVIEIAREIEASTIVVHPGDRMNGKSFENAVKNIKLVSKIAEDISIAIENLYTSESGIRKLVETPKEMKALLDEVSMDNVGACLDVGHAYIASQMHGFDFKEFFNVLDGHIIHSHIHNNCGMDSKPWDKHMPLTKGNIDYNEILESFKVKNVILEIKRGSMKEVISSLNIVRETV